MDWSVVGVFAVSAVGVFVLVFPIVWLVRMIEVLCWLKGCFWVYGDPWDTSGWQSPLSGVNEARRDISILKRQIGLLEQELGLKPEQRIYHIHGSVTLGDGVGDATTILAAAKQQGVATSEPKPTVASRLAALEKKRKK